MPAASKLLLILPALALLAACEEAPYHPGHAAEVVPPPPAQGPPVLTGALGAPLAPAATMPLSGGTVPVVPGAPVRLTAPEVSATFANNTARGVTTNGLPYAAYFAADGQQRFVQGSYRDYGTWRVLPDGRFCTTLTRIGDNVEQCYIMYRSGNTVTFQRPDGVTVGSVDMLPGDPMNL